MPASVRFRFVRGIFVVLLCVALALVFGVTRSGTDRYLQAVDPSLGLGNERAHWEAEVTRLGARDAYRAFVAYYSAHNSPIMHALAHQMGDIIYDAAGVDGLEINAENS